ncbi:hypothetical protein GCM10023187_12390 [Nibrella viscosa]|uniref:Uncharacterized protein n=1 Tax=Nibrella viscosa TaxID=1084524 RepID=A0ABP8K304_9BACT
MSTIETKYVLDIDDVIDKLGRVTAGVGEVNSTLLKAGRQQPFTEFNSKATAFNQTLAQQVKSLQDNNARLNAMKAELASVKAEYTDLVKRQQEFIAAGQYQELQQRLKQVEARLAAINREMGGSSEGVKKLGKGSSELGTIWSRLKQAAIAAFAVDRIVAVGTAIVQTTAKFEKYEAVLTNAVGSRSGAVDGLRLIAEYAAQTPYSVDELTSSFIKFVNRGLVPTKEQLTQIGDLAASQGKSFDQLTEAILDAQSGEFERLKEFGIRASKSGDQVSLSFKGVTQTVKATSGAITEAILGFGKLNGVAGSTAAISQTLEGAMSNFGDQVDRLAVSIGSTRLGGAFKELVSLAGQLVGVFTDLISVSPADTLRQQQAELNGLVGALVLANDNEAVRLSLIQQLSQKYPEFLGQLDAEAAANDVLVQRLAAVNAQYEKKIRIALGQEKIQKVQDQLTASIRQQSEALRILARESGKTIVELEKLSPAQRLALARQVAAKQSPVQATGAGGGLTLSTDPRAFLDKTLESAQAKQVALQKELNSLLGEQAQRQADLTKTTVEGYQKDIAQIREKIRLKQIDKKLGEEEIKRLETQIRQAQGLAANVDNTPIGAGSPPKKKTGKTDAQKAYEAEQNELLKAGEDYVKAFLALEEQYGKKRLETLSKNSEEYIKEKAALDLKEIQLARDTYERQLQLAASNKTEVLNGKRFPVPNTAITLANADPERAKLFVDASKEVEKKRDEDIRQLRLDHRIKMLGLERRYDELEIAETEKKWDELIKLEKEGSAEQQKLRRLKQAELDRITLGQAIDKNRQGEAAALAFIGQQRFETDLRAANPNIDAAEVERARQEAILAVRIEYGEKLLALLKAQGEAENALIIAQTQEVVDGLKKAQGELKSKPRYESIWQLLGVTNGMNAEQLKAFKEGLQQIGQAINETTQAIVQAADARIQALNGEISAKEQQVQQEEQRAKEGAANNLAIRRAELEDLKRQKAEEEAIKRRSMQVQQSLDLASMVSNNALAATNTYLAITQAAAQGIKLGPIAGPIAIAGLVALIFGTILAARARIKAMQQLREGGQIRFGRSHEQGGHRIEGTDIEVESEEWVVNRRSSKKHTTLIEAINDDDPVAIRNAAIRYVERPFVARPFVARPAIPQRQFPQVVIQQMETTAQQQASRQADLAELSELKQEMALMNELLASIKQDAAATSRNTARRVVSTGEGTLYIEDGSHRETKKLK